RSAHASRSAPGAHVSTHVRASTLHPPSVPRCPTTSVLVAEPIVRSQPSSVAGSTIGSGGVGVTVGGAGVALGVVVSPGRGVVGVEVGGAVGVGAAVAVTVGVGVAVGGAQRSTEQSAAQQSPSTVLPSSHASPSCRTPSPHTGHAGNANACVVEASTRGGLKT